MTVQEAKESLTLCKITRLFIPKNEVLDFTIEALEELEQYRALGTVEELREAREKQIAKKPNMEQKDSKGNIHSRCPNCLSFHIADYCIRCGQKIDWEEGEEDD